MSPDPTLETEQRLTGTQSRVLTPPTILISLILILLLATLLRLFQLPTLPPGLNFDEAGNGVAALDILQGTPKLWWRIGGGKEPLWPYILAVSTTVLGNQALALRLPAALIGILTVAAVYPLVVILFRGRQDRHFMALLTMLGLALSGWHLHFSRLGFRAILLPLLSTLAFYFLWSSFISEKRASITRQSPKRTLPHITLSAFFIALAIYAYLAARLLPGVPLLFLALFWLLRHRGFRLGKASVKRFMTIRNNSSPQFAHALIRLFAFLILFLSPLILYFLFNPVDLVARSASVSIFDPTWNNGDLIGTAWRTIITTVGTFIGFSGDANPLVNLPGQPAVPAILAPFFVLGLIVSLYRSLLPAGPAAHLFLLSWWVVMLLPAILAPEGAPHHLRLIGTIIPTHVFAAMGLASSTSWLVRSLAGITSRIRFSVSGPVYLLPVMAYLVVGFQTYTNYFIRWPATVDFTLPFDLYAVRLADDITHAPPNTTYVLPMDIRAGAEARHYTLDYLLANSEQIAAYIYIPVDERNAETLLTQAAAGNDELRVVRWTADKHHEADAKEIITYLLETQTNFRQHESFPVYDLESYTLANSVSFRLPTIDHSIGATFDGLLRIEAANVPSTASPGDRLPVALTLAPLTPLEVDYKASLRLVSPTGERVAQKDRLLLHNYHQGTSLWPPETVNEYYLLPIPPETPPGEYTVRAVIYEPETQSPLIADGLVEVSLGEVRIK